MNVASVSRLLPATAAQLERQFQADGYQPGRPRTCRRLRWRLTAPSAGRRTARRVMARAWITGRSTAAEATASWPRAASAARQPRGNH
jgi:hypothetical protein